MRPYNTIVLAYSLMRDLSGEVSFACGAESLRTAWKRAAVWYGGFVMLLTLVGLRYGPAGDLRLSAIWKPALTSTLLDAAITAVIPGMMAAALYLARRPCSRRSILLVTMIVAMVMTAFALTVRPLRIAAEKTLQVGLLAEPKAGPVLQLNSARLDLRMARWRDIQTGIQVIPFALLGILLARRKGWAVALGVAAYFSSWTVLVDVLGRRFRGFSASSPVMQGWWEIGLNVAALALLYVVYWAGEAVESMRAKV